MSSAPFFFYALSHMCAGTVNSLAIKRSENEATNKNQMRFINIFFCFFLVCNNLDLFGNKSFEYQPSVSSRNLFYILDFVHLVLLPLYIVVFGEYTLRSFDLFEVCIISVYLLSYWLFLFVIDEIMFPLIIIQFQFII